MSDSTMHQVHVDTSPAEHRLRTIAIVVLAVVFALLTLYAVLAAPGTVFHELAHDGRHLLGAPCH